MTTSTIVFIILVVIALVVILAKKINSKVPKATVSDSNTPVSGFPKNPFCGNCVTVNFHADKGFSFTARWKDGFGKDQSAYLEKGTVLNGIQAMAGTASGGPFTIL